jgi:hypothetical protein
MLPLDFVGSSFTLISLVCMSGEEKHLSSGLDRHRTEVSVGLAVRVTKILPLFQDWQVPLVLIADAITVAETLFDEFRDCYFNALHAILMHLPSLGED